VPSLTNHGLRCDDTASFRRASFRMALDRKQPKKLISQQCNARKVPASPCEARIAGSCGMVALVAHTYLHTYTHTYTTYSRLQHPRPEYGVETRRRRSSAINRDQPRSTAFTPSQKAARSKRHRRTRPQLFLPSHLLLDSSFPRRQCILHLEPFSPAGHALAHHSKSCP
jgi:hypothetical protein